MDFQGWITSSGFKNPDEMHKSLSHKNERFLRYTIYPMFYNTASPEERYNIFSFPLVNKTYSTRKRPIFVIENNYYTIVFLLHIDWFEGEGCWEVSVHIKDSKWCDAKISEFKRWLRYYYPEMFCEMNEMPERFKFPKLDIFSSETEDFCIEFWNEGKEFMLFKLFDCLRTF